MIEEIIKGNCILQLYYYLYENMYNTNIYSLHEYILLSNIVLVYSTNLCIPAYYKYNIQPYIFNIYGKIMSVL